MYSGSWSNRLSRTERSVGWIFFVLYLAAFPLLMAWVQRAAEGEWPAAEANAVYYLLLGTLSLTLFWNFLRQNFSFLLDWLPENLSAIVIGFVGATVLNMLLWLLPWPVANPNLENYRTEFFLSPGATALVLIVLIPLVEETLFRGLLFESVQSSSRALAYVLSVFLYCLNSVWQFVFTYDTVDPRYLLLAFQYLPNALALTWCYDKGGSLWASILLHAALNTVLLLCAVY